MPPLLAEPRMAASPWRWWALLRRAISLPRCAPRSAARTLACAKARTREPLLAAPHTCAASSRCTSPTPPHLAPPQLHVTSTGGHSSMPPIDGSSVGAVVGRLLTRLSASPPPPRLVSPVTDMLRGLAPYAPGGCQSAVKQRARSSSSISSAGLPTGCPRPVGSIRRRAAHTAGCSANHQRPKPDSTRPACPHALSGRPAWMAAVLSAVGRVPGVDALVARLMASASAEAAALVGGWLAGWLQWQRTGMSRCVVDLLALGTCSCRSAGAALR